MSRAGVSLSHINWCEKRLTFYIRLYEIIYEHEYRNTPTTPSLDHSPIRQTFKFENNFSTIRKHFLNLVKLCSLVVKYCKMSKKSNVKFSNFVYFCILLRGKSVTTFPHSGNAFPQVIQKYIKVANFTGWYFPHFTIFCNQTW